ncbi:MAG: MarR family transcriptional regulator [Firmicutes bacterium]|nr:MarR family transcriptional regulator [Bacillota bacterium]
MHGNSGNVKYLSIFSDMIKKYQENCKATLDGYSFTPNETAMMIYMLKNPDVDTAKEIAQKLNISQSLICRSVDSLTRKGFIDVVKDRSDRRVNHLSLKITDDQLKNRLLSMDGSFENLMTDGVEDDDMLAFRRVVERMASNVGVSMAN